MCSKEINAQQCFTEDFPDGEPCVPFLNEYNAIGPFYIRIYVHVIQDAIGEGGQTDEQVEEAISYLDEAFNRHNIFFVWDCEIIPLQDAEFFEDFNPPTTVFQENPHIDGVDIYLFPDNPPPNSNGAGNSKGLDETALAVAGNYSKEPFGSVVRSHVLSHEMGHVLGLIHTFGQNGGVFATLPEYVDQVSFPGQCLSSGDCICDTEADPFINNNVSQPSEGCIWELAVDMIDGPFDINNDEYNPSVTNIMSYSHIDCLEELTLGQGRRMRNIIAIAESEELQNSSEIVEEEDYHWLQNLPLGNCIVKESIATNTIWTNPIIEIDGIVEVKNGAILTIEDNVEVRFPRGSVLRVMPGGTLVLKGKLTNNSCVNACNNTGFGTCGDTWKGVEVWGDKDEHQFIVGNNEIKQGRIITHPGAIIENAEVGVQLWGPELTDAGGIINSVETIFRNNIVGVDFRPYKNFHPDYSTNNQSPNADAGLEANYNGTFTGCIFENNNSFPHSRNFDKFIYLEGVNGPTIRGCDFINENSPSAPTAIHSFGYGVYSYDSGFTLENSCDDGIYPCDDDAQQITSSRFYGLGHGVRVIGGIGGYKPFRIKNNIFEHCFVGISNRASSNGEIFFNTFKMGSIPSFWQTNSQLGIALNGNINSISLEQNEFIDEIDDPNTRTIGISTTNTGTNDLTIRNNIFESLNIGNEAGGNCGSNSSNQDNPTGLQFICNENVNNSEYDFLICSTPAADRIHPFQGEFISSNTGLNLYRASGNQFSNSGSNPDRDFSNQGDDQGLRYYFYNVPDQNPNETSGVSLSNKIPSQENTCPQIYCEIPCKTEGELIGIKNSFFGKQTSFQQAIVSYDNAVSIQGENSKPARKFLARANNYKRDMTRLADVVLRHTAADNQIGKRDSVRTWMSHKTTFGSELTLSFDFLKTNEHSVGLSKLNNLSNKFDLDSDQEMDQSQSLELYGILAAEPSSGFTKEQLSSLETIANSSTTFASGYAKNVLEKYNIKFPIEDCEHWNGMVENIDTRGGSENSNNDQNIIQQLILNVYPNPAKNQVNFEWDNEEGRTQLRISDLNGKVIFKMVSTNEQTKQVWNTFNIPSGIYFYEFNSEKSQANRGRIVVQR